MKKHVLCVIMIIFFISICYTGLRAGVPDEKETLYYSIIAYNGKEYSETFCSNISDTIYLLSDTNNFLTLHQSLLYKWDIADRYYLDYQKLNIPGL